MSIHDSTSTQAALDRIPSHRLMQCTDTGSSRCGQVKQAHLGVKRPGAGWAWMPEAAGTEHLALARQLDALNAENAVRDAAIVKQASDEDRAAIECSLEDLKERIRVAMAKRKADKATATTEG